MTRLKIFGCLVCLHGFIGLLHGADKYTDENRPYEFGFTIDGEQHRHEKKDENGIIMGEFGFITADGVYHVTVYATDENGRFKILSMKNIRVKPYPTAGGGEKKGHAIPFPPSQNAPVLQGPSKTEKQESKPIEIKKQISSPAKSCSHCSLPTTTTKAPPPQLTDIAVVSKDLLAPGSSSVPASNIYQQNSRTSNTGGPSSFGQREADNEKSFPTSSLGQPNNLPSQSFDQNNPQYLQGNYNQERNSGQNYLQQRVSGNQNFLPSATNLNYPHQNNNENSNIPPSNQYYSQNRDNVNQNNLQVGNDGIQYKLQNGEIAGLDYPQEQSYISHNNPQKEINADQYDSQLDAKTNSNYAQSGASAIQPQSGQKYIDNLPTPKDISRNPKQYNDISTTNTEAGQSQGFGAALASLGSQPVSNRPTLLAAQMQVVPKDTNIHHRNPGEQEGLPEGLSKDDMTNLLYTFNYTVGFHGHHEEGYSNGSKQGYYYVTGRNGVRTRVDYIADEKGFRPRISQEVLDILSEDVPKPETEKDEKFGLKGYEFKWLYYPADVRKQ